MKELGTGYDQPIPPKAQRAVSGKATYVPPPRKQPLLNSASIPRPAKPFSWRLPIGVAIFTAVGLGFSLARTSPVLDPVAKKRLSSIPEDVSDRYHAAAEKFDKEVGGMEMVMGMNWLRSWLTREASGHVLEMGVGTGRNSRYYRVNDCQSITMVDQAPEMLDIARVKFRKEHPMYQNCRFVAQSVHEPIQHPPGGFDTIIQTMGVCSTAKPAEALRRLGDLANPDKGRILLLEHGRSHYAWLNDRLDQSAPAHADKYGCWWNKDIGRVIEESGLEVVQVKRYHFGTTWWVELRPKKTTS